MSSHPLNLFFRFMLEVAALLGMGYWGWVQGGGALRFTLVLGIPLLAAVLWGTFAVPDDPSRSGRAPVPVPGLIRLVVELVIFGTATWMLYTTGAEALAAVLGTAVVIHYAISYDRIRWLLTQ
jgi:hypothetical protein